MSNKQQQAKGKTGENHFSFTRFWSRHKSPIIITLVCFAVYSNSLFNGYNLDDELVTKKHPLTSQGIKAIPEIFSSPYYSDDMGYAYDYRPLVHVSFAIEHQLFGEHVAVSHFINVLLYALLCVVVFFVLRSVFGVSDLFSLCTALIFALHPLHTEVICSVKNRDEVLSLLFSAMTIMFSFRYIKSTPFWLLIILLFYSLTLLSKYSGVIFSAVIPTIFIIVHKVSIRKSFLIGFALAVPTFFLYQQPLVATKLLFSATLLFIPLLYYIPFQKIFIWNKRSIENFGKLILGKLVEMSNSYKKAFSKIFRSNEVKNQGQNPTIVSLNDILQPCILFLFITTITFFANRKFALPIWLVINYVLYLTSTSYPVKFLTTLTILVGIVSIEYPLPLIGIDNPLPTITLVMLISMLTPERSKRYSRLIFAFLTILLIIKVILHPVIINDIGSVFPLAGLLFIWLGYVASANFYRLGIVLLFLTTLLQGIVFILALIDFSPYQVIYEGLTFLSLTATLFVLYVKETTDRFDKIWLGLIVLSLLFYRQYIPKPNYNLIATCQNLSKSNDLAASPTQTATIIDTSNVSSQLSFEIFSKPSDRQIAYVESPVTMFDDIETRIASAAAVVQVYFRKLFVPYPMAFYYGYKEFEPENLQSSNAIVGLLIHVLLAIVFIYALITEQKTLAVGLLIYLVSAAAVSGFLQPIAGVFADRFALIPSLGFSICITWLLFRVFKTSEFDESLTYQKLKPALKYTLVFIFVIYGSLTFARNFDWKDDLTLMRKDIKVVDKSAQAHNLLAIHLVNAAFAANDLTEQQRLREEALHHLKKAQEIYPPFFNVSYDIARLYILLNKPDSALQAYENTIALDSTFSDSHLNAGEILFSFKRYEEAVPYFAYVIKDRPNEYLGYDKLSYLYFSMKEYQKSVLVNKAAIQKLPNLIDPYINIGRTFIAAGQNDSALYYLQIARNMDPANQLIIDLQASVGK